MDRYSENHLVTFEQRINAYRAWLDEHPSIAVPWGRWIADEGYAVVIGEIRRLKDFEARVMADVLESERTIGSD